MLQSLGQFAGEIEVQSTAEGGIQGVQAVIDGKKRKAIFPAPLAEALLLGAGVAVLVWLARPDEAVQIAEHVAPRVPTKLIAECNRDGACGAEGGRIADFPQAAAAASREGVFFQTVDADVERCRTGDHGGLLSSKE